MTYAEIVQAIEAMPVDSIDQVLCVDVIHADHNCYVVGGLYYSTALDAAAAVQDLA